MTSDEDVSLLKRIHHALLTELSKELDYTAESEAFQGLMGNQDLKHLRIESTMDDKTVRDRLMASFEWISDSLGQIFRSKELRKQSNHSDEDAVRLPVHKEWKKVAALRTAIFAVKPREFSDSAATTSSLKCFPFVPNMERLGTLSPVVVRKADESFWQSCIELSLSRKVCGVGVPGIGKTTTTFYLLQKLIVTHRRTVVYAVQNDDKKKTVYYKLVPILMNDDNKTADAVEDIEVTCLFSQEGPDSIDCLQDRNAYFVLDPGHTKYSCDVPFDFMAHFILVCSCDATHWGGEEFEKMRSRKEDTDVAPPEWNEDNGVDVLLTSLSAASVTTTEPRTHVGVITYCPSWSLQDVLLAKSKLGLAGLTNEAICYRYRLVGGSVRRLLDFNKERHTQKVENALSSILETTAKELADGKCDFAFSADSPQSVLVSVEPKADNVSMYHLVLSSEYKLVSRGTCLVYYSTNTVLTILYIKPS